MGVATIIAPSSRSYSHGTDHHRHHRAVTRTEPTTIAQHRARLDSRVEPRHPAGPPATPVSIAEHPARFVSRETSAATQWPAPTRGAPCRNAAGTGAPHHTVSRRSAAETGRAASHRTAPHRSGDRPQRPLRNATGLPNGARCAIDARTVSDAAHPAAAIAFHVKPAPGSEVSPSRGATFTWARRVMSQRAPFPRRVPTARSARRTNYTPQLVSAGMHGSICIRFQVQPTSPGGALRGAMRHTVNSRMGRVSRPRTRRVRSTDGGADTTAATSAGSRIVIGTRVDGG